MRRTGNTLNADLHLRSKEEEKPKSYFKFGTQRADMTRTTENAGRPIERPGPFTHLREEDFACLLKPQREQFNDLDEALTGKPFEDAMNNGVNGLTAKDFGSILDKGLNGKQQDLTPAVISRYLELIKNYASKHSLVNKNKIAFLEPGFLEDAENAKSDSEWDDLRYTMTKAGCGQQELMDLDYVFVPYHQNKSHWILLGIAPKQQFLFLIDSICGPFTEKTAPLRTFQAVLMDILPDQKEQWPILVWENADKYSFRDIGSNHEVCNAQEDMYNCSVFAVTNAMCLAFGYSLFSLRNRDLDLQKRPRIAAEIINNGFEGEAFGYMVFPIEESKLKPPALLAADKEQATKKRKRDAKEENDDLPETKKEKNKPDADVKVREGGLVGEWFEACKEEHRRLWPKNKHHWIWNESWPKEIHHWKGNESWPNETHHWTENAPWPKEIDSLAGNASWLKEMNDFMGNTLGPKEIDSLAGNASWLKEMNDFMGNTLVPKHAPWPKALSPGNPPWTANPPWTKAPPSTKSPPWPGHPPLWSTLSSLFHIMNPNRPFFRTEPFVSMPLQFSTIDIEAGRSCAKDELYSAKPFLRAITEPKFAHLNTKEQLIESCKTHQLANYTWWQERPKELFRRWMENELQAKLLDVDSAESHTEDSQFSDKESVIELTTDSTKRQTRSQTRKATQKRKS